ncbi:Metallo-dependent hydrolase [Mollisia scopiformis]|uniref:N-acetylglucosamine-6-phosphate deacetylase n=1 Tax=Mollisia scopiformis TaxID=149040 RepID=A0A194XJW2_MOLSC|nr:Metallo-dependent hydrolase [Mollisia scopiformis]KUJ20515.1 Metallo-dependent hydrolase [Mollisia scopiformis]
MPIAIPTGKEKITKFTNCRLIKGNDLVEQDLWVSSETGKIVRSQEVFYSEQVVPDITINLGGRIISPGLIDVQLNGAFGFNFSQIPDDPSTYSKVLRQVNKSLVQTGVTSYLPTLTSETPYVYKNALPHLGPSGFHRIASDGAESLGAHCEGPFLSPTKNGIHKIENITPAINGFSDLEAMYGSQYLNPTLSPDGSIIKPPTIKKITAAPEIAAMMQTIPEITSRGIIYSIGHTEATYEDASRAVAAGATMITHLFNAMRPLHHRNPGVFGVLGIAESLPRPYFGIISDGIHLHPTSIKIAFNAHPDGFILVTDAMHLVGLPDGVYEWTNGESIVKNGPRLVLEGTDKIAGSSITLIECVTNFLNWSGASLPLALKAVTATPAATLGLSGVKGCLEADADADLVIIEEEVDGEGRKNLRIDQVWKFGTKPHHKKMAAPFGFSIGDFIAAIELVGTVIDALRSSGSASTEYRELVSQLLSLEMALIQVKNLEFEECQYAEVTALRQAAVRCRGTIDAFWEKVKKYQPALGGDGSGVRERWMRMRKRSDLQDKRQIERHKSLVGVVQDGFFACMQRLVEVNEQGKQLLVATTEILKTNVKIFQAVLQIQHLITNIPGQIERQQPVYMVDALGRASPFHLEFIRSAEACTALKSVLRVNFQKHGNGAHKIDKGEFVFQDAITKADIDVTGDWETCFRPGQRIEMNMVCYSSKLQERVHATPNRVLCPRCLDDCGATNPLLPRNFDCTCCGLAFQQKPSAVSVALISKVDAALEDISTPQIVEYSGPWGRTLEDYRSYYKSSPMCRSTFQKIRVYRAGQLIS